MGNECSTDKGSGANAPSACVDVAGKRVLDYFEEDGISQQVSQKDLPEVTRLTPLPKARVLHQEAFLEPYDDRLLWKLPPAGRLTVLMFGMTGAGKSSVGNCIAGFNAFEVSDSLASVTNLDSVMRYHTPDSSLILLDTIGLGDTELEQEQVVASIRDMAVSATDGIDVLFFVMKNTRLADDAIARLIYVIEYLWTDECLLNLYIIVTCAPRYLAVPADGLAWIEKQLSNWRFAYIYKLVGENPNRFIFVDNPDIESGEPNVPERQLASRNALMKALASHPRQVIPAWTSDRMRDAQERTQMQREELQKRAEEVMRAETALEESKKKTRPKTHKHPSGSAPGKPISESPPHSSSNSEGEDNPEEASARKELEKKRSKMKQAEDELSKVLKTVAADSSFNEQAVKEGRNATMKFAQQYQSAEADKPDTDGKPAGLFKATKNLVSSLLPKGIVRKSIAKSAPATAKGKVKVRVTKEQLDKIVDELVMRMVTEMKGTPEEVFRKMDELEPGNVSPVAFQQFLKETLPGINRTQVGALWRRVDRNCDGYLSLQEFSDLCKGRRGGSVWTEKMITV